VRYHRCLAAQLAYCLHVPFAAVPWPPPALLESECSTNAKLFFRPRPQAPASAKLRKSWESFGGSTPKPAGDGTPAAGGQHQMNEAVVAAAMAAGMEFMRHLQAAGVAGGTQPSPFADINPLRAAAAAAAAAAASPALSAPSFAGAAQAPSAVAASPRNP